MFGTGLLKGMGVTLKHFVDTYADDRKASPSRYEDSTSLDNGRRVIRQPLDQEGLLTVQYPEEKRLLPERFRYIPMLIWDTDKEEDRCTACGICAKVCPPQCIWIVRDTDENGKPVTRPAEFYIDGAVCMSCSFCVEFCPFDAIMMNHDYELAVFDRYPNLVYDKEELTVPVEYYAALWPREHAQREERRRREEEEERAKEEAKKKKAEEEKAQAEANGSDSGNGANGGEKPKRSKEEIEAMKQKAAAKAAERKAGGGEQSAQKESESGGEDADAKKARMEELKRKAQEKAKQRKESGE